MPGVDRVAVAVVAACDRELLSLSHLDRLDHGRHPRVGARRTSRRPGRGPVLLTLPSYGS